MDKEKLIEKCNKVLAWLDANDAGAMEQVIRTNIEAALKADNDEERDKMWTAVRSVCNVLDNSPIRRMQGASSKYDAVQQANFDALENEIQQSLGVLWNSGNMQYVLQRHGKSGGGLFDSDEDYYTYASKAMMRHMKDRLDDGIWDGTIDGLSSQTFPEPEVQEQ